MTRITCILMLLLVLGIGVATAQSYKGDRQVITVTGKVVSVTNDEPLIGATVKGIKEQGVATDCEGNFSIKALQGSTLVVSYVGYDKAEVTVSDTTIIVRLIPAKPISGWIYLSEISNPKDETHKEPTGVSAIKAYALKE